MRTPRRRRGRGRRAARCWVGPIAPPSPETLCVSTREAGGVCGQAPLLGGVHPIALRNSSAGWLIGWRSRYCERAVTRRPRMHRCIRNQASCRTRNVAAYLWTDNGAHSGCPAAGRCRLAAGAIGLWAAAPGGTTADRLAVSNTVSAFGKAAHGKVQIVTRFLGSICRCVA